MPDGKKIAVLLVNLGSPDAPSTSAVRRYLREFLSDPRVVNIPRVIWWLLLNLLVLPLRPRKSANAYQKIWTDAGSPLVTISRTLAAELAKKVPPHVCIELAMRYGKPSIGSQLEKFNQENIAQLIVLPLYPQYSTTTTASVFDAVMNEISSWQHIPSYTFISDYHQDGLYIASIAATIKRYWEAQGKGDKLLFSFHGLPKKSIELGDPYHAHCQNTADRIAEKLELDHSGWEIVFQSRFGKAEWLKPYCVDVLEKLPAQGLKQIDIVCPGFAVDCLETLEEIAITNKALFLAAGGRKYHYIPALNATEDHAGVLFNLLEPYLIRKSN